MPGEYSLSDVLERIDHYTAARGSIELRGFSLRQRPDQGGDVNRLHFGLELFLGETPIEEISIFRTSILFPQRISSFPDFRFFNHWTFL